MQVMLSLQQKSYSSSWIVVMKLSYSSWTTGEDSLLSELDHELFYTRMHVLCIRSLYDHLPPWWINAVHTVCSADVNRPIAGPSKSVGTAKADCTHKFEIKSKQTCPSFMTAQRKNSFHRAELMTSQESGKTSWEAMNGPQQKMQTPQSQ